MTHSIHASPPVTSLSRTAVLGWDIGGGSPAPSASTRRRWTRTLGTAVVTGLGDFIAAEAACRVGLDVMPLVDPIGDTARTASAAAVAWLLADATATA